MDRGTATSGGVSGGEQLLFVKFPVPLPKSRGTQLPETPNPLFFTPYPSAARIAFISAACFSHGPRAEAKRTAIRVPAAKQFLFPLIARLDTSFPLRARRVRKESLWEGPEEPWAAGGERLVSGRGLLSPPTDLPPAGIGPFRVGISTCSRWTS